VTDAAAACGMAAFKFGREFKEEFGMDFREYVLRHRVREACRLLENPNASVTEICYAVGFSEPAYFSRMFKRLVGRSPSEVVGESGCERLIAGPQRSANYKNSSAKS
jgi:two-component system response regulator YesN